MRRVGDRRSAVRLEVVGALWGTLEFHKQARVCDLNQDGALLEYPVPVLPIPSTRSLSRTTANGSASMCGCATSGMPPVPTEPSCTSTVRKSIGTICPPVFPPTARPQPQKC